MQSLKGFASDNYAPVHPEILAAISAANAGHVRAYGDDPLTQAALESFKSHFGPEIQVGFVFNGTAANILCLRMLCESYEAVVCAESAHIVVDECGAPERQLGSKVLTVQAPDGKLTPDLIRPRLNGWGNPHHVQPRVVSITQSTELGTVYSREELKALCDFAHAHGMWVHLDGARLANAAASLGASLRELTTEVGIDALSFGGTKNGLLLGEAVVLFRPERFRPERFAFLRKQSMQLASKMRFISAQFQTLLSEDLWLRNAKQANEMARLLEKEIREIPELKITQPVQANAVFVEVPAKLVAPLQARVPFYVWNAAKHETPEVRWMAAYDTTEEDVREFARIIRQCLKEIGASAP